MMNFGATSVGEKQDGPVVARNPYIVLGLSPRASDSEIRAAFRKLAKKHHPDANPDDKKSEDKFKEISAAFDIVGRL